MLLSYSLFIHFFCLPTTPSLASLSSFRASTHHVILNFSTDKFPPEMNESCLKSWKEKKKSLALNKQYIKRRKINLLTI